MSQFVTQLVDDQPTLVVVAPQPVPPEILAGWKRSDLAIESYTPDRFLANYARLSPTIYRVIVWLPNLDATQLHEPLTKIVSLLNKNHQKCYVVSSFVTPINDVGQFWKEWHAISHQQALAWQKLQQLSPSVVWIFGQDIVNAPHTLWIPGQGITRDLNTGALYDPHVAVYPQDFAGFWRAVFELVIDPTTTSTVLQGKKQLTTQVLQRIRLTHQRLSGQLATIVSRPAHVQATFSFPTMTLAPSLLADDTVVDEILQQRVVPVVAIQTPVIKPQLPPTRPMVIPPRSIISLTKNPPAALPQPKTPALLASNTSPSLPLSPPPVTLAKPVVAVKHQPSPVEPSPVTMTFADRKTPSVVTNEPPPSPPPSPQLDDELNRVFQHYRQEEKTERTALLTKKAKQTIKKTHHRKKIFWGGVAAGSVGLLIMALAGSFWFTSHLTKQQLSKALMPGNLQHVLGLSAETASYRLPNRAFSTLLAWETQAADLVLSENTLTQSQHTAQLATELRDISQLNKILQEITSNMYGLILGQAEGDLETQLSLLSSQSQKMYEKVSAAEVTAQQLDLEQLAQATGTSSDQIQSLLTQAKRNLTAAQLIQPLWSRLLGVQRPRTYAVLWQNSLELRPTGGFIQAVALVTVENGQIKKTQVFNSYDLDQRLTGEVQPPAEITELLGEKQWFFRDSNWSSDFPAAARQATTYLNRLSDQQISGVIALTLPSATELIEVVGPVAVPGYAEPITAENLVSQIEAQTKLPSAQTTASQDFQTLLLEALLNKIQQLPASQAPRLATVLNQEFTERQLLIALTDINEEATFQTLGWTGALPKPVCPGQLHSASCFIETVTQTEANVGVNLANITVQRQVAHQVTLTASAAAHRRQITFTNAATQRKWPRGDYKAYIRLYVPPTANLSSIKINGRNLGAEQVRQSTESALQVWGWTMTVPADDRSVVEVDYLTPLPASVTTSQSPAYGLLHHYQPGISPVTTSTNLSFPMAWSPTLVAPSATVAPQQLQFISPAALHTLQAAQFTLSEP